MRKKTASGRLITSEQHVGNIAGLPIAITTGTPSTAVVEGVPVANAVVVRGGAGLAAHDAQAAASGAGKPGGGAPGNGQMQRA